MKNNKGVFYLIIWFCCLICGGIYSGVNHVLYFFQNDRFPTSPPYPIFVQNTVYFIIPIVLVPCLICSLYNAIRENDKTIILSSSILLVLHILFVILFITL